jgi:hypothetical protein
MRRAQAAAGAAHPAAAHGSSRRRAEESVQRHDEGRQSFLGACACFQRRVSAVASHVPGGQRLHSSRQKRMRGPRSFLAAVRGEPMLFIRQFMNAAVIILIRILCCI